MLFTAIQSLALIAVLPSVSGHAGTQQALAAFSSEVLTFFFLN